MPPIVPRKKASNYKSTNKQLEDDGTQVEREREQSGKAKAKKRSVTKRKRGGTVNEGPDYKIKFKEFVLNHVKIGVPGLLSEFDEIKKQTQPIGSTPKVAFDSAPEKNRYKDVYCVDESRVILTGSHDYIHANWVEVCDSRKYICTQGPIVATIDDFWRMIWQEKIKLVSNL